MCEPVRAEAGLLKRNTMGSRLGRREQVCFIQKLGEGFEGNRK